VVSVSFINLSICAQKMLEKIPGGHHDALHQSVIDARGTDHTLTLNDLPFASLNFVKSLTS
jgi:hypothetical protein